ncbi:hydroxyacid dehydrogenase [Taibaiella sp. KBW10]|uniref:NAD(P)-dependent oxidoreductase n=1 Tax=Taibaiella sp. KBW10 TaxID=2153357 RepID=UPI000F5A3822|nr:NAD(P)-dependent oxidoreductase [Taibaiella sp. KBW10]RQO30529.1 hydroxyacid dehydrogenase [Taibaiella sp. KBW10]
MSKPQVLVITPIHPVLTAFLTGKGFELIEDHTIDYHSIQAHIGSYTGIITSTKIKFDRALLDKAAQLRWIARMGSGMEHIDVPYAQQKQIQCISSPEGNANAVAEQALGMYLALQHRIVKSHQELQKDIWLREENRGYEIEGTTAGIIGLGNNGYRFAQKLSALGVSVLAYDIAPKAYPEDPAIKITDSLDAIYAQATMISFHVPYNQTTHHYFNDAFYDRMQQPFTLLNLSRGEVACQDTVYKGLTEGKIIAAALDVWEKEPTPKMAQTMYTQAKLLLSMPNFIGTAHIGGYTYDAIYKMSTTLREKLGFII